MNNIKNTIELNEEVYTKSIDAHSKTLQKINEDYQKKLKADCERMRDAYNRFINTDIPNSFQNHDSRNKWFELSSNKFKMHCENVKPENCIPNYYEINDEIEKKLSLKLFFELKSTGWYGNYYRIDLKERKPYFY